MSPQNDEQDILDGATEVSTGQDSGGFVDDVKYYWRRMNDILDTSLFTPLQGRIDKESAQGKAVVDGEINHAHPVRAALAQMYYGSLDDATKLAMSFTTPKQTGLQILTAGQGSTVKAVATGANLYFAYRGSQAMFQGRQDGETQADALQRELMGAATAASGAAGATATVKDTLHSAIRNNLGINGDLAAKVQEKMQAADTLRKAEKAQLESVGQIGSGIKDSINKQALPERMGKITADASQAVYVEKARVEGLFDAFADKATTPVTDAADLRSEIVNTLKAHGIQDKEIPERIFNAIPNEKTTTVRQLTASETKASFIVAKLAKSGMNAEDIRLTLVNQGYTPSQVDPIMYVGMGSTLQSKALSFKAVTRVKGDLWDALLASKDPTVRRGLSEALDNVTGMQDRYAEANDFGPKYKKAKQEYAQFKNELGSGLMSDFVAAKTIEDQAMLPRVSQLIKDVGEEQIVGLLKKFGIDTSPIDALVADKKAVAAGTKQTLKDISKQADRMITDIGKAKPIIKGTNDLELAGKTTDEIRLDAVRRVANNARAAGITNPYAYIQIMIGLTRMLTGSVFGTMQAASGSSRIGIQMALQNKSFQDWVIQESGVEAPKIPAIRKAIANSYPFLRDLTKSSVLPRAIDNAAPRQPDQANQPREVVRIAQ